MSNTIKIGIADMNTTTSGDTLVTYALGSCVGICLHDKSRSLGGLAHIMLPDSKESANVDNSRRYADTGIKELVDSMLRYGASIPTMTAKIAGGAQMFQTQLKTFNIGERNVQAVKRILSGYGIRLIAEDTGADYGRTVFFDVATGVMQVKSVNKGIKNL